MNELQYEGNPVGVFASHCQMSLNLLSAVLEKCRCTPDDIKHILEQFYSTTACEILPICDNSFVSSLCTT